MRVLVVDDNMQVRKLFSIYLEDEGHQVDTANDGQEGWEIVSNSGISYDLVFVDIRMPNMNGLELLEKIKLNSFDLPVIIMTGHADADLVLQAFKLGAFDFLTKPFEYEPLLDIIEKIEYLQTDKLEQTFISQFCEIMVTYSIPSQTKNIKSLIPALQNHYQLLCALNRQQIHRMASCLFEAVNNAIVYGNLGLNPRLKTESLEKFWEKVKEKEALPEMFDKKVTIKGTFSASMLKFEVEDCGPGFNYKIIPAMTDPSAAVPGGRGLFIVRAFMDEVSWNEKGNCITMIKYLEQPL
jgi:CheY-like chemotaxis protein